MSITRDRGYIVVECEECHETLETETKDFAEAREVMTSSEWLVRKRDGTWLHFCTPHCLQEYLADRLKGKRTQLRVVD